MKTKVCPACNSRDISLNGFLKYEQEAALFHDVCKNCGYVGLMTAMKKGDADRLRVAKPKKIWRLTKH